MVVECIFFDGLAAHSEADEYVQVLNNGTGAIDLAGWKLTDIDDGRPEFVFGGYSLAPGQRVRVYTNLIHPQWGGFSFGSSLPVWNNDEPDMAGLFTPAGALVSTRTYPPGCE